MAKRTEDTPLIKQFFEIKAQHPQAVLLYRVGDFYETYSDDALLASKVLGLVLTKKSNGNKGYIEMAGFPYHAMDNYLPKLVNAGYKVAVCDQLENPALTKSKLVKRGVTEILTPGLALGENMLERKEHNFLAGIEFEDNQCGIAFLDASTGTFQLAQGSMDYVTGLLSSFNPKEVIVRKELFKAVKERFGDYYLSSLDEWAFVYDNAVEKLKEQLQVSSLKGYAIDNFPIAISAAGALLVYLEQTHHGGLKNICSISRIDEGKFVWMDKFTVRNLEIFRSSSDADGCSLVDTIDRCCSPMGSRLLRQWLALPQLDVDELNKRYDIVQYFLENPDKLEDIRLKIGDIGDVERSVARVATGKIQPRETLQLGKALGLMEPVREICSGSKVKALDKLAEGIKNCSKIHERILRTLNPETAPQIGKGPVIAEGIDAELDELRRISQGGKSYLQEMQLREIENTGISSLKIAYNNVFGYYIEVRNTFKDKVPENWIRKQTLVNAERYITPELKEYEEKILRAEATIYEIEERIYSSLTAEIQNFIRDIQENCRIIARLDVLQAFARQAIDRNYCRPEVDKSSVLEIKDGRHPVIESLIKAGEEYVPNDIQMDSRREQIIILTGPNMSGKSALLRQTALIVLLAQCGSFVPASKARIGICDKIFTRVGASDNISRGESTFMVEMLETSMIMHNLSARSLVLLDEIGRGTATYDGMSIARALVEYIHEHGQGAKTLFATHYHELNDLEHKYQRIKNYHISVKEDGQQVIFLRKMLTGAVARSFGIHVARMAGMPREIVESAERTLKELELKEKHASNIGTSVGESLQLSLFQLDDPTLSSIRRALEDADLNNMTPLQAFDLLRAMKKEVGL